MSTYANVQTTLVSLKRLKNKILTSPFYIYLFNKKISVRKTLQMQFLYIFLSFVGSIFAGIFVFEVGKLLIIGETSIFHEFNTILFSFITGTLVVMPVFIFGTLMRSCYFPLVALLLSFFPTWLVVSMWGENINTVFNGIGLSFYFGFFLGILTFKTLRFFLQENVHQPNTLVDNNIEDNEEYAI